VSVPFDPDEQLIAELAEVLLRGDVPADVLAAAREAFTWRTVDADLAELTYDSLVDAGAPALRAGEAEPQLLVFTASGLTIEVEVTEDRNGRRMVGQVLPAGPGQVWVRSAAGSLECPLDDLGRFIAALPPQPQSVTLACRPLGGETVETAAVVI
jgi:hypothetical protein